MRRKGNGKVNNVQGNVGALVTVNTATPIKSLGISPNIASFYGRNPMPIPSAVRTLLSCRGTFNDTTANPGLKATSWKLNALIPSAGFEYGYGDEICAMYKRYRVVSSSLSVVLRPTTNPHRIAIYPTSSNVDPGTMFGAMERRFGKSAIARVGGNKDQVITTSSVHTCQLAESALLDKDYTGAIAAGVPADPPNLLYWWTVTQPAPAGNADCNIDFKFVVEVIFSEPVDSTSSDD
jgi:hypothetical protein